jgi:signal transduction histidine kinase/CheY-like chemotaxis protein
VDGEQRNEFEIRTGGGGFIWVEGSQTGVYDAAGRFAGIIATLRDMTRRLALEDKLRRKSEEAEAATVAKSQFLANMSHELRTPLTAVTGFADLLANADSLALARRYADRIVTAAEALRSVVNAILDFSRIEAGQVELDARPFDPRRLLEETADLVREQAVGKGLALRVEIERGAPAVVVGDAARVRQVLLNLLSNAVKFTKAGAVTLSAGYDAARGRLSVAVEDSGIGVPPEVAGRLFQRFSQGDASSSREYGGAGLGLAISKGLIEAMGGEIGMDSRPEGGSRFWFALPAPAAAPEAPAATEAPEAPETLARILVVDDVAVNRELIRAMLTPFAVELAEAAGGREAVAAAMKAPFDVILMDLQMPGMDGLAATAAIRAAAGPNRATPILAISANVLPEQVAACRRAGMADHIAKPINPTELVTKVAAWAGARTESRAAG